MYKNMYIKLNGVYFFKYPEYNFITIAYLYSAVVGTCASRPDLVGTGRNLCASGASPDQQQVRRLTGIREESESGTEM
jgi:hypothetical protein